MKGVVVECPPGVFTRIMPGSQAMEFYEATKRGEWGSKSKPGPAASFRPHMEELHRKFLKEQGRTE
jgi:hypothetical protein